MNFLFHMLLSGDDDQLLVGNFMGDFVKGRLGYTYPDRVRQGLVLHRKIDSYAQRDANFQASRLRLSPVYGLYRGILVDLFYDHFLAREWSKWTGNLLSDYILWARSIIEKHRPVMPKQLQASVPVIFDELLPSYESIAGIEAALLRMARRVKRPNPLAEGGGELTRHYKGLEEDFEKFIISVKQYSTDIIESGGLE